MCVAATEAICALRWHQAQHPVPTACAQDRHRKVLSSTQAQPSACLNARLWSAAVRNALSILCAHAPIAHGCLWRADARSPLSPALEARNYEQLCTQHAHGRVLDGHASTTTTICAGPEGEIGSEPAPF